MTTKMRHVLGSLALMLCCACGCVLANQRGPGGPGGQGGAGVPGVGAWPSVAAPPVYHNLGAQQSLPGVPGAGGRPSGYVGPVPGPASNGAPGVPGAGGPNHRVGSQQSLVGVPGRHNQPVSHQGALPGVPGRLPVGAASGVQSHPYPIPAVPHGNCPNSHAGRNNECLAGVPGMVLPGVGTPGAKGGPSPPQQPFNHAAGTPGVHGSHGAPLSSQVDGLTPPHGQPGNAKGPSLNKGVTGNDTTVSDVGREKDEKSSVVKNEVSGTLHSQGHEDTKQQETVSPPSPVKGKGVDGTAQVGTRPDVPAESLPDSGKENSESDSTSLPSAPSSETHRETPDGSAGPLYPKVEESERTPEVQSKGDGKTQGAAGDAPRINQESGGSSAITQQREQQSSGGADVSGADMDHKEQTDITPKAPQQDSHNAETNTTGTTGTGSLDTADSKQKPTMDTQATKPTQTGVASGDSSTLINTSTESDITPHSVVTAESETTNGTITAGNLAAGKTTEHTNSVTPNTPSNGEPPSTTTTTTTVPPVSAHSNTHKKPSGKGDANSSSISSVWVSVPLLIVVALFSTLVC